MRTRAWALVLAALLAGAALAAEAERVVRFHSDVTVNADASLTVTETIEVMVAGEKIKHGIVRYFPIFLRDRLEQRSYGFKLLRVLRDGSEEEHFVNTTQRPDYASITIGDFAATLSKGKHTYTLTYHTTRHIRHFRDHDELYWNVNGTEWKFPFDAVAATVALPKGAKIQADKLTGYTGGFGKAGKDFVSKLLPDGRVHFEATRPFKVGENLSIVVPFDKGALPAPAAKEQREAWVGDNLPAAIALGGCAALIGYLFLAWLAFGRWPWGGKAVPRSDAPVDAGTGRPLSPAEVRYLCDMDLDSPCVTAALVDMGVKGYLVIEESKGKNDELRYSATRRPDADETKLSDDEKLLAGGMFGAMRSTIRFEDNTGPGLFLAVKTLREQFEERWAGVAFRRNRFFRVLGWLIAAGVMLAVVFCRVLDDGYANCTFAAVLATPLLLLAFYGARHVVRGAVRMIRRDPRKPALGEYFFTTLAIGAFSAGVLYALYWLSYFSTFWVPLGVVGLYAANLAGGPLLPRYTRRGRRIMSQVRALREYLTDPEPGTGDQAGLLVASPEGFEWLVPYAMATGVGDEWAQTFRKRFDAVVADRTEESGPGWSPDDYQPAWYKAHVALSFFTSGRMDFFGRMGISLGSVLPSGKATSSGPTTRSGVSRLSGSGTRRGYSGGGSSGGGGEGW